MFQCDPSYSPSFIIHKARYQSSLLLLVLDNVNKKTVSVVDDEDESHYADKPCIYWSLLKLVIIRREIVKDAARGQGLK